MRNEDKPMFARLLAGVGEIYGKDPSPTIGSIYFEALKQFDIEAVQKAFMAHVNNPDNGQFFPKPADIVKMIGGSTGDRGMQAWSKVDRAVRQVGPYTTVVFDDPVIHRVIQDMGGWVMLGMKNDDEWPFVAREFVTRYQGYSMRGEIPEHPKMLHGIAQIHNEPHGHAVEAPRLLGDSEKAKQILLGHDAQKRIGVSDEAHN